MSAALLRIELRRNTVLLLLPVLAALAVLSPAWRHLSALALWPGRSIDAQTALQGVAPLFAGAAAWVSGRERRRAMDDLLATTPRSAWARLLTMWAATTLWGVLLYLVIVAVILGVTARQATWGAPVPWPLLVGLLELPAFAALGCTLGHALPSRFTPPLVGVVAFVAQGLGVTLVDRGSTLGLLTPGYPSISFSVWSASSPRSRAGPGALPAGPDRPGPGRPRALGPGPRSRRGSRRRRAGAGRYQRRPGHE